MHMEQYFHLVTKTSKSESTKPIREDGIQVCINISPFPEKTVNFLINLCIIILLIFHLRINVILNHIDVWSPSCVSFFINRCFYHCNRSIQRTITLLVRETFRCNINRILQICSFQIYRTRVPDKKSPKSTRIRKKIHNT